MTHDTLVLKMAQSMIAAAGDGHSQARIAEAAFRAALLVCEVCAKPGHASTMLHGMVPFVTEAAKLAERREALAGLIGHG